MKKKEKLKNEPFEFSSVMFTKVFCPFCVSLKIKAIKNQDTRSKTQVLRLKSRASKLEVQPSNFEA